MEEARQYPALRAEQKLYTALQLGGSLLLAAGIILHLAIGGQTMGITALAFIATRLILAMLRVVLPLSVPAGPPSKAMSVTWLIVWVGIALLAIRVALG